MSSAGYEERAARTSRLTRHATLSSFAYRNFSLYFYGQMISVAGTWMQSVAQAYLVLHLTNSGTDLGILAALRTAPILVLGPWGGLLVDRISRVKMLYFTNAASCVLTGILATFVLIGGAKITMIYLVALGLGLVQVVDNPARQVILADLVPIRELPNAVSLNSVMVNTGRIFGPGLAGVVIAAFGIGFCFALNSASFVVVLITLFLLRKNELEHSERFEREKGQIRAGLRYVRSRTELVLPLILLVIAGTLTWEFQVSIPLIAQDTFHGGAGVYGALFACAGLGAVVGGLVTASRTQATNKGLAYSAIGWGIACVLAGLAPTLTLEYPAMVLVGYGSVAFNSISKTKLQVASTPAMRGRVMALWAVAWVGTTPFGGPLVGYIGQHLGARWAWYAGGAPLFLAGLIAMPYLLRLDDKAPIDAVADDVGGNTIA